jgi:hypothetical protein
MYLILCVSLIFSGCTNVTKSNKDTSSNSKQVVEKNRSIQNSPKQVVKNYFKYKNEKNKNDIEKLLTKDSLGPNHTWGFEDLEYIKLININEETNPTFKDGYLSNGRGSINGVKKENVKVYKVDYNVKYKEGAVTAEKNGKNTSWFFVIRKDKNSPWLIDGQGQP